MKKKQATSIPDQLTMMLVALAFVFPYTHPPITNFWPVLFAWVLGSLLVLMWMSNQQWAFGEGEQGGAGSGVGGASALAWGLMLASVLGAMIGLLQYFQGGIGFQPWVSPSAPGNAIGNLRQRNQQASLMALGVFSLLWLLFVAKNKLHESMAINEDDASLPAARVHWSGVATGVLIGWIFFLISLGSASTSSRTGFSQWFLVLLLFSVWGRSVKRPVFFAWLFAFGIYIVSAWMLPGLLESWSGYRVEGLFRRLSGDSDCTSRRVLWSNVLYLIAQKPWLGWGWGELDYAHYITLFPGERFCVLLDNAHNLPLHLAVELGVPVAVLVCLVVLAWIWNAKPWRETDPARQLAWGILALVGLHSMLEFPLWYGPFQLVTVLAILILWRRRASENGQRHVADHAQKRHLSLIYKALAAILIIAFMGYASWDYSRISQVYKPVHLRSEALRENTLAKVSGTWLFADAVDFAVLTTTPVTKENAQRMHVLATALLHYSPEPRVIEPLIESASLLGRDDEVAFHMRRYRAAYPKEYERWSSANRVVGAPAGG